MMKTIVLKNIAIVMLGLLGSIVTYAQYVWVDEKGTKQYSDMPPPPNTPRAKILKAPNLKPVASSPASNAATGEATETPAENPVPKPKEKEKAPLTTAEKNTEYQKRKMAQAEKDKKAAEESKAAADKKSNCESARAYQRNLESGQRVAQTNKNGEKFYMDDKQRAQEIQKAKQIAADCN